MIDLELFTEADFAQLIGWLDHERLLTEWSGPLFSFPLTPDQLRGYLQHANQPQRSERFAYKAVDADSGAAVGHISLDYLNWNDQTGRITRVLVGAPAARGHGVGQAMVKAALRIGFEELGLRRISLGVYDFNATAIRCYQRCGFRRIGTLQDVVRFHGEAWSSMEMSIMKHEWTPVEKPPPLLGRNARFGASSALGS